MSRRGEGWPVGYVLRGGPRGGKVSRGGPKTYVAIEWDDGTRDLYRPSGESDSEHPELERFDFEEIPPLVDVDRWAETTDPDDPDYLRGTAMGRG
jgi:hypothetical protein